MKKLYKIICSSNKTNSLFDASKELEEFLFAGVSFRLKQPSTSFNHWKDHISEMKNYSWDSAEDCVCYIRSHIRWRTVHSIQNWGSFACRLNFWLKQLSTNRWKSHLLEMKKTMRFCWTIRSTHSFFPQQLKTKKYNFKIYGWKVWYSNAIEKLNSIWFIWYGIYDAHFRSMTFQMNKLLF